MDDSGDATSAVTHPFTIRTHWPVTLGCYLLAAIALVFAGTGEPLTRLPWAVPLYQMYIWCFFTHSALQALGLCSTLPHLNRERKRKAMILITLNAAMALCLIIQRFLGRLTFESKYAIAAQKLGILQGTRSGPPMQNMNLVLLVAIALMRRHIELSRFLVIFTVLFVSTTLLGINLACSYDPNMTTVAVCSLATAILMITRHRNEMVTGCNRVVKVDRLHQRICLCEPSTCFMNVGVDAMGVAAFAGVAANVSISSNIVSSPGCDLLAQFLFAMGEPCWIAYSCSVLWSAWQDVPAKAQGLVAAATVGAIVIFHMTVAAHVEAIIQSFHVSLFDTTQAVVLRITLHAKLQHACFGKRPLHDCWRPYSLTIVISALWCLQSYRALSDVIGRLGVHIPMVSEVQAADQAWCTMQGSRPRRCSVLLWWCFTPGVSFIMCFASVAFCSHARMVSLRLEEDQQHAQMQME